MQGRVTVRTAEQQVHGASVQAHIRRILILATAEMRGGAHHLLEGDGVAVAKAATGAAEVGRRAHHLLESNGVTVSEVGLLALLTAALTALTAAEMRGRAHHLIQSDGVTVTKVGRGPHHLIQGDGVTVTETAQVAATERGHEIHTGLTKVIDLLAERRTTTNRARALPLPLAELRGVQHPHIGFHFVFE